MTSVLCWACSRELDAQDRYCRSCGQGQGEWLSWHFRPWGIAVLTALALGPFGAYLVWRTPRLGPKGKGVAYLLVALYTAWFATGFLRALRTVQDAMDQAVTLESTFKIPQ